MATVEGLCESYSDSGVNTYIRVLWRFSYLGRFYSCQFPNTPASATYSIDGQSPNGFLVPAPKDATMEWYNRVLFQTGRLPTGNHKLVVTYNGNLTTTPLALDYFILQDILLASNSISSNATNATSSVAPSSSSSYPASNTSSTPPSNSPSNPASNSTTSSKMKAPLGAIIGGAIGGLILVILLISLLFLVLRRNKRKPQGASDNTYPASDDDVVQPFTLLPPQDSNSRLSPTFLSQHYISNGQSSPSIAAKLKGRLADKPSTSSNWRPINLPIDTPSSSSGGGTVPTSTAPPYQSSSVLPLSIGETNVISGAVARGQSPETVQPTQRPTSPRDGDAQARYVRHEDSGLRIPPVEENVVELPPLYTPG